MTARRDVAVVLSGGGMNGVLMEHGFMLRLRETSLWPRVGWIFGTSAGALVGSMAALERLDELERFLLTLQPEDTFRPNRLWRLPFLGLHEYALPRTIEQRIGDLTVIARELAACERELVVCATDASSGEIGPDARDYELVYSSKRTDPETMAQAILASAAISALVMPMRVGDVIATDGAWVRNFPLAHAYARPGVRQIVAFCYIPQYPTIGTSALVRLRERLSRFGRVPPIRAFIEELREAEARDARGEPGHLAEMILRLTRAAIVRNTVIEERLAAEKDQSIHELARLQRDMRELVTRRVRGRRERARFLAELDDVFGAARFPFRHERAIPRITVRASITDVSLDAGRRDQPEWTEEAKRALIRRGYELADTELAKAGVEDAAEEAV
ncbi:MAG TPA: patatin-like phospholipase family protein [Gaiellaceae bacterium]